jgi:hypothetical protein
MIEAALSPEGTPEIPAVICYEGIYVRDHWDQLTPSPWWYRSAPDVERQVAWRRDAIARTGQDWFVLAPGRSREERRRLDVQVGATGVYLVDRLTGGRERIDEPRIGGWTATDGVESLHPAWPPTTPDGIDQLVPQPPDVGRVLADGRGELAAALLAGFGASLYPIWHVSSPLWRGYHLWGFEGLMTMVAERPELVEHACRRYLALGIGEVQLGAALGAAGVWIEDCMTDAISPRAFARLNLPFVRALVEEVRAAGLKSIYYYCGDPTDRWDHLLAVGADALSLEESKKGFVVDVDEVVQRVRGRCAVLGNLDAIELLPHASEDELRAEIQRQVAAGRRNGSRFVMSLGSPVTPGTPVSKVRLYCDLAHELGRR